MSSSSIQGVLDVVNISKRVVELAAVTDTCCEGFADSFGHLLDVGLAVDLGHRVALLHRQCLGLMSSTSIINLLKTTAN